MNIKTKLGLGILMLTLILLFSISSTFSKYISAIDASDEARVAIWDINITKDVDLFKDSYTLIKDGEEYTYVKSLSCKNDLDEDGNQIENCDNVIAPGTNGEYKFFIKGKPETNYKIKLEVLEKIDSTNGRVTFDIDGQCPTNNINALARCIENIYSKDDVFSATEKIDTFHTISWKWDFEVNEEENKKDTEKGNAVIIDQNDPNYNNKDVQPMIKLKVKITAEQTTEAKK